MFSFAKMRLMWFLTVFPERCSLALIAVGLHVFVHEYLYILIGNLDEPSKKLLVLMIYGVPWSDDGGSHM